MSHKNKHHKRGGKHGPHAEAQQVSAERRPKRAFEIVLKCDSAGSLEAVRQSLAGVSHPELPIEIIHAGIGSVNKTDILMAETGNRLIVGFAVDIMPKIDDLLKQHNVEVRLYTIIYKLLEDVHAIVESLLPPESTQEQVLGSAKVIALFKSSRKGIILGCEVREGHLAVGQRFRVISAMGPVYDGRIESLHIEKDAVQKATVGQQVGLKIGDFNKAQIGYLVESYRPQRQQKQKPWAPGNGVISI